MRGVRHVLWSLALLALLAPAAWGSDPELTTPVEILVETVPTGATLVLQGVPPEPLGQSGRSAWLSVPRGRNATLYLRLSLEGYEDHDLQVHTADLGGAPPVRIPAGGAIVLVPRSPLAPARLFVQRHAWAAGGTAAVLLVVLLGWVLPARCRMVQRYLRLRRLAPPPDPLDPRLGGLLGGWLLVRRLGAGASATVYEAVPWQTLDAREAVAVKIMHSEGLTDEWRARFAREVNVCRTLDHPNLVRLLDWHEDGDVLAIVMELVRGTSLRTLIPPDGLPLEGALDLLRPLALAVGHAHGKGIVHNDLKPENIMVTDDGRLRVMDFGVSSAVEMSRLTATGDALGTPGYMAPERYDGVRSDPRSDQYSVGCIAWHVLVGRPPLYHEDPVRRIALHLSTPPEEVSDVRPTIPRAVSSVIGRMLAKKPEQRFPGMEDAWDALEAAAEQEKDGRR